MDNTSNNSRNHNPGVAADPHRPRSLTDDRGAADPLASSPPPRREREGEEKEKENENDPPPTSSAAADANTGTDRTSGGSANSSSMFSASALAPAHHTETGTSPRDPTDPLLPGDPTPCGDSTEHQLLALAGHGLPRILPVCIHVREFCILCVHARMQVCVYICLEARQGRLYTLVLLSSFILATSLPVPRFISPTSLSISPTPTQVASTTPALVAAATDPEAPLNFRVRENLRAADERERGEREAMQRGRLDLGGVATPTFAWATDEVQLDREPVPTLQLGTSVIPPPAFTTTCSTTTTRTPSRTKGSRVEVGSWGRMTPFDVC